MKKEQLRVGNLVWYFSDKGKILKTITAECIVASHKIEDWFFITHDGILLSDYLRNIETNDYKSGNLLLQRKEGLFFIHETEHFIKYLHELQNLHFFINGNELNLYIDNLN